jgi:hypothetical protein
MESEEDVLKRFGLLDEDTEMVEFVPAVQKMLEKTRRLAERIAGRILSFRDDFDKIMGILDNLEWGILGYERPLPGVAVDSTFPIDGGVDLVGGHLAAVIAGYIGFSGVSSGEDKPVESIVDILFADDENMRSRIPLYAKIAEKKITLKVLEKRKNGQLRPEIILFDGELVPYKLLFRPWRSIVKSKVLTRLDEATMRVLENARKQGVTLIGVVKRSYSRLLRVFNNGERLPLNDKAIMSMILRPGSYVVLGRFSDLVPQYAEIIAEERKKEGKNVKGYVEGVRELLEKRPAYGEVTVAFYKPRQGPGQAVRVEILDYGNLGIERVLSILSALTNPATGLPYPIDLVDSYVRLESYMLELVRRRIIKYLVEMLKEEGLRGEHVIVMSHTNPEKRYLYEKKKF